MPPKRSEPRQVDRGPPPKRKAAGTASNNNFKSSFDEPASSRRVLKGKPRSIDTPDQKHAKRLGEVQSNFSQVTPSRESPFNIATQSLSRLNRPFQQPVLPFPPVASSSKVTLEGSARDQASPRSLPVTSLQLPSVKSHATASAGHETREGTESPVKTKRRDRRPKYNFRELAGEALKRRDTDMSLWSHEFSRCLSGDKDNKGLMQLMQSAKFNVKRVFTPIPSQSSAVLVQAELQTPSREDTAMDAAAPAAHQHARASSQVGLVILKSRSQNTLAHCSMGDGTTASVLPCLRAREGQLSQGDEVWLLEYASVTLLDGQQALLSDKYTVVRQRPGP